jgi:hypothetical protein
MWSKVAILDRFGLGWLEAKPRRKTANLPALEAAVTKLREREKRLASRLRELDGDEMFDVVMAQLRTLRGQVSDAATWLQAARQQAAVAEQSVKIEDTTDRAMIGSVPKHQLVSARFGKDNHVALMTAAGYVLSVIAKVHAAEKKSAWLERAPKPEVAQYPD